MELSKYDISTEQALLPGTSHALMLELVGSNKRVLDIGCDTGYLGRAMIAMGNRVSGVEINPVSAEEAAKHLEKVVVADLETGDLVAEFGRDSFDVVVLGDVLEHLRDPVTVLRQARPLLAARGYVVISTPNIAHGDVRLALLGGRFNYTKVGLLDDTHLRFFTRDSLVEMLHDAGFVLTDLRRSTAPLFTTELALSEADFDPALVASLRDDIEATTYQFVLSAVADDATSMESRQALHVDELNTEAARLRTELAAATEQNEQLSGELAALRERLDNVQAAHDEAVRQRDAALDRLSFASLLRSVAGRLRNRSR
ncbi:MAG TPA: methyltransferase domain-containing protein [Jatrophihabitantaceae bacterium]|nr:methyltransferase domain-containing protein [Jatrophihabitantaceae bacterium]